MNRHFVITEPEQIYLDFESVLRRTIRRTQIIVVDDCSTDDSFDIIGNFKDIEVHLERNGS
jgi:glycosyltransferase involved in cell wall biosynthesis